MKSHPQILLGSIGWEDQDDYYFLGTDDNDGHTFVRVQLFEGRDITKPLNQKRAQGHKIVCHIPDWMFRIPPKDTLCYVAVPHGMEQCIGIGLIIGCVRKSPTTQFAGDRTVLDFGDDQHVVIRGKSVAMQSPDNEFISVGTPRSGGTSGLTFQAKDGTGGVIQEGVVGWFVAESGDAKTLIQMTPSKVQVLQKVSLVSSAMFELSGGNFTLAGPGTGYIMPATMVLGVPGVGSPPYKILSPATTMTITSPAIFISTDA